MKTIKRITIPVSTGDKNTCVHMENSLVAPCRVQTITVEAVIGRKNTKDHKYSVGQSGTAYHTGKDVLLFYLLSSV